MYKEFVSEAASAAFLTFVAAVAPVLGTDLCGKPHFPGMSGVWRPEVCTVIPNI